MRYDLRLNSNLAENWSASAFWLPYARDYHDAGFLSTPSGLIGLRRLADIATIRFVLNGRYKLYVIRPCPTRRGLVVMARRLIRQISQQNGKASG